MKRNPLDGDVEHGESHAGYQVINYQPKASKEMKVEECRGLAEGL